MADSNCAFSSIADAMPPVGHVPVRRDDALSAHGTGGIGVALVSAGARIKALPQRADVNSTTSGIILPRQYDGWNVALQASAAGFGTHILVRSCRNGRHERDRCRKK